jgi:hypothetical protein
MTPLRKTLGAAESATWLQRRGLTASKPHWFVEIAIEADSPDTRFELNIYPEEWGFVLRRGSRVSSIRVTDVAFIHGQDDHDLLALTPSLDKVGNLLAEIQRRHGMIFRRTAATVRTNLVRATVAVRSWLAFL